MPASVQERPTHLAASATADSVSDATLQSLAALYTASVSTSERAYDASISGALVSETDNDDDDGDAQPYFDFDVQRNLTVTVGQTGFLHCRVERLGDQDVSPFREYSIRNTTPHKTTHSHFGLVLVYEL